MRDFLRTHYLVNGKIKPQQRDSFKPMTSWLQDACSTVGQPVPTQTLITTKQMSGWAPGRTVMAPWTTAAIGATSSSTTAKLSPVEPYRSGDVKSGSNGSPEECIVTTVKLLASPAYLTWCLRGAPRVEKHVPRAVANCCFVWQSLCFLKSNEIIILWKHQRTDKAY